MRGAFSFILVDALQNNCATIKEYRHIAIISGCMLSQYRNQSAPKILAYKLGEFPLFEFCY